MEKLKLIKKQTGIGQSMNNEIKLKKYSKRSAKFHNYHLITNSIVKNYILIK